MQITTTLAQTIVNTLATKQASITSNVNITTITNALSTVKSTTFATLTQASKVKTSASNNAQNIFKITVQNVTLCNSSASLYNNAVTRTVIATQQATAFTALPSNYVMLNNSYSVCALKSNTNKHYLRAIVNKCLQSVYFCATTNTMLTKQQVAQYLTASASKQLLSVNTSNTVQHADITHNVTARTFALSNIFSINVNKQSITA